MKRLSPTTKYILKALIPYTDANLRLAFKPSSFFYELSKRQRIKEKTVQSAYYRAINEGLIVMDGLGHPRLTDKGVHQIKIFEPTKLDRGAQLVVFFDIPEAERAKRDHLRSLLKELSFKNIQKSVWSSAYDHRDLLLAEIEEYDLQDYVYIYEAIQLKI